MNNPRIIVALDFSNKKQALEFASKLDKNLCRIKIGKELFTTGGPQLIEQLMSYGFDIFLDLKYHDIPNTVANACRARRIWACGWLMFTRWEGEKCLLPLKKHFPQKKQSSSR